MGQLDSGFPSDERSYGNGKNCGHRYSLLRCSSQEQWQLENSCLGKDLNYI